jgi:hypothetical protein
MQEAGGVSAGEIGKIRTPDRLRPGRCTGRTNTRWKKPNGTVTGNADVSARRSRGSGGRASSGGSR